MSVWFGLHLPSYTHPDTPPERLFDRVVEQAQAAEAAGFGLVSVMDHLYQIETGRLGRLRLFDDAVEQPLRRGIGVGVGGEVETEPDAHQLLLCRER